MKILKHGLACAAAAAACAAAFADGADDATLSVRTTGPDRYLDGTVLMDGECYALVWSADGKFEGFDAGGAPVDPEDRVVSVGAVARGGRCSTTFDVRAGEMERLADGYFAVYALDTRVRGEAGVAPAGVEGGRPKALNGYGRVTGNETVELGPTVARIAESAPESEEAAHRAGTVVAATRGTRQPRILKIAPTDDKVELWVENLGGHVRVQGGRDLRADGATSEAVDADAVAGAVRITMPKTGDQGFFKAVK